MPDKKILLIDDDMVNLRIGLDALKEQYQVFTALSGEKISNILDKCIPDLILLDIEMPKMNGFEVFEMLKSNPKTSSIPVIFLTSSDSLEYEKRSFAMGAADYMRKPYYPPFLCKRIGLHFQISQINRQKLDYEKKFQLSQAGFADLQSRLLKTVIELIERRDEAGEGHVERTKKYIEVLLDVMIKNNIYSDVVATWEKDLVLQSSMLYDLGKVSIRDDILLKPEKLEEHEYSVIKNHTLMGVKIIDDIRSEITGNSQETHILNFAKEFAGYHHEKWDGTGYPNGLKGYNIPLPGRLMAIVDVYDALISKRSYKRSYTPEEAAQIISHGKGKHFDPILVDVFLSVADKFSRIVQQGNGIRSNGNCLAGIL